MAFINKSAKEIQVKVVYYGPGRCGKTTNLLYVNQKMNAQFMGKMISIDTRGDKTLFFDFLPLSLGKIRGFNIRVQLYTVPGQVLYNESRKMVLKGVDGVVFVADSMEVQQEANKESLLAGHQYAREFRRLCALIHAPGSQQTFPAHLPQQCDCGKRP